MMLKVIFFGDLAGQVVIAGLLKDAKAIHDENTQYA